MKRKLFLIFIILNFLFILAGCGNDPYPIERKYWYLQREAKKIFANPDATPNRQVNKIVNLLNNFAKKHPNTTLEVSAEFSIASIFIVKKEYTFARKQLQHMLNKYKDVPNVCSEAVFLIGNTYELDDKWEQALTNYKRLTNKYPTTTRGMKIPLYIAQYYKAKYQPDKMKAAYSEAANHYIGISQANLDKPLGFSAVLLAVEADYAAKDFQGCINAFDSVINNYTNKDMQASAMMNKALIYFNGFKDKEKTKETLQQLINKFPNNRLADNALKFLNELNNK